MLTRAGHRVLVAGDAAAAAEIWARESAAIAVLITDLELGDTDGAALTARFRASRTGLPVILISGYSAEEIRARYSLPPEVRFLPKPFTTTELLEAIRPLLPRE